MERGVRRGNRVIASGQYEAVEVDRDIEVRVVVWHQVSSLGKHRLVVGESVGKWTGYGDIAVCEGVRATTVDWGDSLPRVFMLKELRRV